MTRRRLEDDRDGHQEKVDRGRHGRQLVMGDWQAG